MSHWKNSIWLLVVVVMLAAIIELNMIECFSLISREHRACQSSSDCDPDQCCADTPSGYKICLEYEQQGEQCLFRSRTPSCGCAKGLKCVSTMPMEPGEWNHDYVCARVRPFMYHKLLPYVDDANLL